GEGSGGGGGGGGWGARRGAPPARGATADRGRRSSARVAIRVPPRPDPRRRLRVDSTAAPRGAACAGGRGDRVRLSRVERAQSRGPRAPFRVRRDGRACRGGVGERRRPRARDGR